MSKNTLATAADRFWFEHGRYLSCTDCNRLSEPCDRELSTAAFQAGARWNLIETMRMSPHISNFLHMVTLLGIYDQTAENVAQRIADALWHATGGDQATTADAGYQPEPPY